MKSFIAFVMAMVVVMFGSPAFAAVDMTPFHKTMGAYAVGDKDKAAALNHYTYSPQSVNPAFMDEGVDVVASGIKSYMYNTLCNGWDQCADYTPANEQKVLDYTASYVQQHKNNPGVIGWYILDDPWTNFSSTLRKVHNVIRQYDKTKPTLCALPLKLKSSVSPNPLGQFTNRAAVNFSPDWCDMFSVYSYAEAGATNVEWGMGNTLPVAIKYLKNHRGLTGFGGPNSNSKRLATPQAFGGGGFKTPTTRQLRRQVRSFCNNGFSGLLPYGWDDAFVPNRASLANSFSLRQGMRQGLSDCRGIW